MVFYPDSLMGLPFGRIINSQALIGDETVEVGSKGYVLEELLVSILK